MTPATTKLSFPRKLPVVQTAKDRLYVFAGKDVNGAAVLFLEILESTRDGMRHVSTINLEIEEWRRDSNGDYGDFEIHVLSSLCSGLFDNLYPEMILRSGQLDLLFII